MASSENTDLNTPISKELLASIHRRQLMNGKTNNVHQKAIVDALGGIDAILQHLFASNVVIDEQQLDSLHRIIANTSHRNQQHSTINAVSQPQEDKTHVTMPTLAYTFKDEDCFLFYIFGQQKGAKILHTLNGKIIKGILTLLFGLAAIVILLELLSIVDTSILRAYLTVFLLSYSIYIIMWILYANKEAMKLLFRQFVFWLKIGYLILFVLTDSIVRHLDDYPPYYICAYSIFYAAILFIVMIFDAINTQKYIKIIISSFAVGVFAQRTSAIMVNTFYVDQSDVYDEAIMTVNLPYVDDKARISIVDMCSNAAQILVIFLFRQLISIIWNPNKALVIATKPFIEYENNKETTPTRRSLKHWQRAIIASWSAVLLFSIVILLQALLNDESHIVKIALIIILVLTVMIGLGILMIAHSKFHWILHILIVIVLTMYVTLIFLFQFTEMHVVGILLQFGVTAVYTLKVSEMDKTNVSSHSVISYELPTKETNTNSNLLDVSMGMDDANMDKVPEILTEAIEIQREGMTEQSISDHKVSEVTEMNNYNSMEYDQEEEDDDEKAIPTCIPIRKEVVAKSGPGFKIEQDKNEHSSTVLSDLFHELIDDDPEP
eukprot:197475_1